MATVLDNRGMDSPSAFSESQTDQDELIFPCKGCGDVWMSNALGDNSVYRVTDMR